MCEKKSVADVIVSEEATETKFGKGLDVVQHLSDLFSGETLKEFGGGGIYGWRDWPLIGSNIDNEVAGGSGFITRDAFLIEGSLWSPADLFVDYVLVFAEWEVYLREPHRNCSIFSLHRRRV